MGSRAGEGDEGLERILDATAPTAATNLPVHRLHLSRYADDGAWQEVVKLLEQFPDVGLVLQVQVQLNYPQDLWGERERKQ